MEIDLLSQARKRFMSYLQEQMKDEKQKDSEFSLKGTSLRLLVLEKS
jgi:hypothetical protein